MSFSSSSPITSVQQHYQHPSTPDGSGDFPAILHLNLRGRKLSVARDTLVNLPESVLVVLFPNGLVFGNAGLPTSHSQRSSQYTESVDYEDETVYVDFDLDMLNYVLAFYEQRASRGDLEEVAETPSNLSGMYGWQNPFPDKTALIVLREELDFYVIPPTDFPQLFAQAFPSGHPKFANLPPSTAATNATAGGGGGGGLQAFLVGELKKRAAFYLLEHQRIFDALRRGLLENPGEVHIGPRTSQGSGAEQQLVDMLCLAGFNLDSVWGFRMQEPGRSAITSISLVPLVKKGTAQQMAAAQKLLLFWRKPARKCWWDGIEVPLKFWDEKATSNVRLWSRRTWTLELALV